MYEQPGGIPAEPPGIVPPQPSYPPVQGHRPPPGAQWYPPASPGYGAPPLPTRRSRTGLWIALGVIGGLLAGGVAYGLTAGSSTAPGQSKPAAAPAGQASGGGGAGAAPPGDNDSGNDSGAGSGNTDQQAPAAGSQPLAKLTLPDSFMGMNRNDDDAPAQLLDQEAQQIAQDPSLHSSSTVYQSGELGENSIIVMAIEADSAGSDQGSSQLMARAWRPVDSPDLSTTHGPIGTFDPGPFGGTLQCAQSFTRTDAADVFGNHIHGAVRCIWTDTNTYVDLATSDSVSGQSVAKGAEVARKFRAATESRR